MKVNLQIARCNRKKFQDDTGISIFENTSGDSDVHPDWNIIDRVIRAEHKSCKVAKDTGFGNERSFTRGMLKKPGCIRLRSGPEVMKWKQQMWVILENLK